MMMHLIIGLFSALLLGTYAESSAKMFNKSEDLRMKILHYRKPCLGEGIQLCYLVSEKDGETEFFYDSIEGFEYEWGYNYEIVVEKLKIEEPLADASSFRYRLKKQVGKAKVSADLRFELPLVVNGFRVVESDGKNCLYFKSVHINTGALSCDSLTKGQKGIFQHTNGGLRLVEIK
jgi:hypothetical protein